MELDELWKGYKCKDVFHCEIRVGIEVEGWLLVSFLLQALSNHWYKGHRSISWTQSLTAFPGNGTDQLNCQMKTETAWGHEPKKRETHKEQRSKESYFYTDLIFCFFNTSLKCRMIRYWGILPLHMFLILWLPYTIVNPIFPSNAENNIYITLM